ncbi:KpsF/GutQ family sugar-phosphate isomerase [Pigmentibacter sp. JX0631]|uniref:KpsF/GutQ family sugar-phosphate isomerase n=1 Tax=Pigmentibacter sp. JX0631 TaxID=2976982 RepID=UPI002468E386|nr:KpsF/GutQ family sugar-phosphate isomerase [Pigmentibacter sp. JX0631]WGL59227.1 KpsF/GutQ family sugar-phosphate isomerase [Pigmentibacter sp. JX0631]
MLEPMIKSAIERTEHFSQAISWYKTAFQENDDFNQTFQTLANELVACSRLNTSLKQVFFVAVGKSAQVAQLAVSMLVSVGIVARFVHPTEAFHGDLGVVGKQDTVVLISNNGKSSELLQLIPGLQDREVKIFVLTSKADSPLAKIAKHVLFIPPFEEKCPLSQAPITSSITSLALCQLLVAATVELRNFPIEEYAKNHPGGAIGKRIFLKADTLMIQGEDLPLVHKDESFKTVISIFTKFSKAAVLVVEGKKFLGLISEKDLRTAMEKFGAQVFELKANEFMNKNPTVISPGMLAVDAYKKMCSKNPPFNLLPVVDEEGNAVGMLRMLDFISAGIHI